MRLRRHELQELLRLVDLTRDAEIDCDEFLLRSSALLESRLTDERPPREIEALLHHLRVCPECLEEIEALLRAYQQGL